MDVDMNMVVDVDMNVEMDVDVNDAWPFWVGLRVPGPAWTTDNGTILLKMTCYRVTHDKCFHMYTS